MKIHYEDELGVADFHLPNKCCILYVSECDIVAGNDYKRRLVRYRNVSVRSEMLCRVPLCPAVSDVIRVCVLSEQSGSSFQELVLVENTRLTEQHISAVQKFVVFDLGLTLLPVSGQTEAAQLIAQAVSRH